MQLQIYIKPQDELFIKQLSDKAKSYEYKGVKSLSELVVLALKAYDPVLSNFDNLDKENLDQLIEKKVNEKINSLIESLENRENNNNENNDNQKEGNIKNDNSTTSNNGNVFFESSKILDLDNLGKKALIQIILDFDFKGTNKALFKQAKAQYKEKTSLVNQLREELIKVVKFIYSQSRV